MEPHFFNPNAQEAGAGESQTWSEPRLHSRLNPRQDYLASPCLKRRIEEGREREERGGERRTKLCFSTQIYTGLLCLFALGDGWLILAYSSKEHDPQTPTRKQRKGKAALRLLSPSPHVLFGLASQPMVTLTFILKLPTSVKPLCRHHHRYSQRYLPLVHHILLNPTITSLSPTSLTPKHIALPEPSNPGPLGLTASSKPQKPSLSEQFQHS